jgi:outer membrane murein-binding lipoprotein Lpp
MNRTLATLAICLTLLAAGCTSSQLAKDEAAAMTVLQKIDALTSDPNTTSDKISAGADDLVKIDPASPFLQKTATAIKKNATPGNLQKVHVIVVGAEEVLAAIVAVAPAPAASTAPTAAVAPVASGH